MSIFLRQTHSVRNGFMQNYRLPGPNGAGFKYLTVRAPSLLFLPWHLFFLRKVSGGKISKFNFRMVI
jgi:hypothetical protein